MTALTAGGCAMDAGVGELLDSADALADAEELRRRMQRDGYLLLRGLLDRDWVIDARRSIMQRLAAEGMLLDGSEPIDGIANPDKRNGFFPEAAKNNAELEKLLYTRNMMAFFQRFLNGPVRHFDYTWLRTVPPGVGTRSHCDVVYMGRGTPRLYTAWTPLGDIGFDLGGLMLLEGSNNNQRLRETYGRYDVDTFCENRPEIDGWKRAGQLTGDSNQVRRSLGGRWLSTEYRKGDVLIFSIFTVHASLDNHSDRIRLSSDSRYQLATEPADERWIGANPIAHSAAGKRGRIC
jgi:hypothetical protein